MKVKLVLFLCLVVLVGCVSSSQTSTQRHHKVVEVLMGKTVDELIESKLGYPDEIKAAPNGNRLLIYHRSQSRVKSEIVYKPQFSKYGALQRGTYESVDYPVKEHCSIFLEIDDSDRVVNVRWRGDGC